MEDLREKLEDLKEDIGFHVNPDSILTTGEHTTFIYFPEINKMFTGSGLHEKLAWAKNIFDLFKKYDPDMDIRRTEKRGKYAIDGRFSVGKTILTDRFGFPGFAGLWEEKNQILNIPKCVKNLLKNNLITEDYVVTSINLKPMLAIDIAQGKLGFQDPFMSHISFLMGQIHAGNVESKQKAFGELTELSEKHPENQRLKELVNTLESFKNKQPVWIPKDYFRPGSGLEKHALANKEELERKAQSYGMKRNPITGILEMNFKEWLFTILLQANQE